MKGFAGASADSVEALRKVHAVENERMLLLRRDELNVRRVEGVGMEQRAWLRGCPRVSNERRIILNGWRGEEEEQGECVEKRGVEGSSGTRNAHFPLAGNLGKSDCVFSN